MDGDILVYFLERFERIVEVAYRLILRIDTW